MNFVLLGILVLSVGVLQQWGTINICFAMLNAQRRCFAKLSTSVVIEIDDDGWRYLNSQCAASVAEVAAPDPLPSMPPTSTPPSSSTAGIFGRYMADAWGIRFSSMDVDYADSDSDSGVFSTDSDSDVGVADTGVSLPAPTAAPMSAPGGPNFIKLDSVYRS